MITISARGPVGLALPEQREQSLAQAVKSPPSNTSTLDAMASATPSTTSEPAEPEVVELAASAVQVARVEHRSASFSWDPLAKVPAGFSACYAIELQQVGSDGAASWLRTRCVTCSPSPASLETQLDGDSNPTTNWVSVYKGESLSCKVRGASGSLPLIWTTIGVSRHIGLSN